MRHIYLILILSLTLLSQILSGQNNKASNALSSVLSSGIWHKIPVTSEGIYRIDYSQLRQLGFADTGFPRIYGNNTGQLSYLNNDPSPDDIKEIAAYYNLGPDGIFNEGDYLLFYANGPDRWLYDQNNSVYNYLNHNYTDTAFYFITLATSPGKSIIDASAPSGSATYTSASSDALFVHEEDIENIRNTGREWYQQILTIHLDPGFTGILTDENIKFRIRVAARASIPTEFTLLENGQPKKTVTVAGVNLFDDTGTYFEIADSTGSFQTSSSSPSYDITYSGRSENGARGWLDRIILQARKSNAFTGNEMILRDSRSVSPGRITRFNIPVAGNAVIWDITDPANIRNVSYTLTSGNIQFEYATDTLRTFAIFTASAAIAASIKPAALPNQDLHASAPADMIVLTNPIFLSYAQKIADIHFANDGLTSLIVTPGQIYNEFSGGMTDISAIRNFVRMKYLKQKGTANPLKYLLLFGDGSFDNKTQPPANPNFIPTYQSQISNIEISSFTSDDFYGLLDDGEGEAEGTEDLGIGRLPVNDTIQAGIIISKIREYIDPSQMGDWKNKICLVADDEDGNIHMSDAEGLASILTDSVPAFGIDKIYLDAFKEVTSINGQFYPDVNKAINDRINSGCLIFNYTGHGNENVLAGESVVTTEDINSWKNEGRLPLFITATCEFSRFDDIESNPVTHQSVNRPSAGEMVLLNKNGGGIALMSTTRLVFSAPNYDLNRNIFTYAFGRQDNGQSLAFGDIIRLAKNHSGSGPNKRNFTLLGDPALKLAYPYHGKVMTDSINGISVNDKIDSLKALSVVTIAGHVEGINGRLSDSFNGIVSPVVYDKESLIKTMANDGGSSMTYLARNSILFSGNTFAANGRFSYSFIVPRDIDYTYGPGKISYYAYDGASDMNGYFDNITIGGFSKSAFSDNEGPQIRLFMNDTLFRDGGITDNHPEILAIIADPDGINTTGSAIGHDLTGNLDGRKDESFILNSYFENDFNSYRKGRVTYGLSNLSEGMHSVTIKAWDNFNNSTEKTISFEVVAADKFVIKNLINFPNPFTGSTSIILGHNRPDSQFDVTIDIYNSAGKIIRILRLKSEAGGYNLPPVTWDGKDSGGRKAGKGMYLFRVTLMTANGETARASGRMIIL